MNQAIVTKGKTRIIKQDLPKVEIERLFMAISYFENDHGDIMGDYAMMTAITNRTEITNNDDFVIIATI